jgi:tetratricopeptide (TPR) repeat protein
MLSQRAGSYGALRRFPEALRKYDQILNITPDDVDTIAAKATVLQAQGDLVQAAALLAPLVPPPDDSSTLEVQAYQAILERRPAPIIARLKEIVSKPDPALGYINGELRFYLGWAQQVTGDHAAAEASWRQARLELEPFLKDQPDNFQLLADLALTDASLGDKVAALAVADRVTSVITPEKDAF